MGLEIKFRGKNPKGTWLYGDLIHNRGNVFIVPKKIVSPFAPSNNNLIVDENTIGQFTGLKDKNDKEIYEGDMFKLPISYGYAVHQVRISPHHLCVEIKNITLQNWNNLNDCWWDEFKNGIEIVGNIFDNPELLK